MKNKIYLLVSFVFLSFYSAPCFSQCRTWTGHPDEGELMEVYVWYRDCLKLNQYEKAFPFWEKVYKAAPDLNARISKIYTDGVILYTWKFNRTKRKNNRTKIVKMIHQLVAEKERCYPGGEPIILAEEIVNFMNE